MLLLELVSSFLFFRFGFLIFFSLLWLLWTVCCFAKMPKFRKNSFLFQSFWAEAIKIKSLCIFFVITFFWTSGCKVKKRWRVKDRWYSTSSAWVKHPGLVSVFCISKSSVEYFQLVQKELSRCFKDLIPKHRQTLSLFLSSWRSASDFTSVKSWITLRLRDILKFS